MSIFSLEGSDVKLEKLNAFIAKQPNKEESLIAVLHQAQELFGYLPHELQLYVARQLGVPAAKVNGVVSFYSFFSQTKRGKYTISVCTGTACFVKGVEHVLNEFASQLNIKNGQTTADGEFTLRDVRCVGACGLAPVVMIGDKVFGHVKPADVAQIVSDFKEKSKESEA